MVASWIKVPEIQVQTPPGANKSEQIFLVTSGIIAYVMRYKWYTVRGIPMSTVYDLILKSDVCDSQS